MDFGLLGIVYWLSLLEKYYIYFRNYICNQFINVGYDCVTYLTGVRLGHIKNALVGVLLL